MKQNLVVCGVSFMLMFFHSLTLLAEKQIFEIHGNTVDVSKPVSGVHVTVYEGLRLVTECSTTSKGEFDLFLDYNKSYNIIIEKGGYFKEIVALSTTLPMGVEAKSTLHQITLKLYELPKDNIVLNVDEPVAKIYYNENSKLFENHFNYDKIIQTKSTSDNKSSESTKALLGNENVSQDFIYELTLRRQKEEIKKPVNDEIEKVEPELVVAKEEKIMPLPIEEEKLSVIEIKEDLVQEKLVLKEIRLEQKNDLNKIMKQTIQENSRSINKIVVLKNGKNIEYTEVKYNHGGVHYFKNGSSISQYTFLTETKQ